MRASNCHTQWYRGGIAVVLELQPVGRAACPLGCALAGIAAALRFPFPAIALADLLSSLEQNRDKVDRLVAMTAERFFLACRLDAAGAARSVREGAIRDPDAETDAWDQSLDRYFDRYESLDGDEVRLQAAIHPLQRCAIDGRPLFEPTWLLFGDGKVADLRPDPGTVTDHARWVADVLGLLDGLSWLGQEPQAG